MIKKKPSIPSLLYTLVSILTAMVLISCADDEMFTSETSANLTFSTDSIKFDTVFTTIGSSTKRFTVYNNNKKGIKVRTVKVASGGVKGFRLNVDGQFGTSLQNVEVLGNDSIMCFVEVTVNPNDADNPLLVEDTVIFNLESGVSHRIILQAYGQDVIIMRGEHITSDRTLTAERPYLFYDSLAIDSGAQLTIEPGAKLHFHAGSGIHCDGTIKAEGTMDNPIIFRGDRLDKMFSYLPYDRLDAQWGGITLTHKSTANTFSFCDIHSGTYGIACEKGDTADCKFSLTNSTIHNIAGHGLMLDQCRTWVANSQITNCLGNCVNVIGGISNFTHCTIAQFYPWKSGRGSALYISNFEDEKYAPLYNTDFLNCIITGYADDEIMGRMITEDEAKANDVAEPAFNYGFRNCFVITHTDDESEKHFVNCVFEKEDAKTYKKDNFQTIDTDIYFYNFALKEESPARGIGSAEGAIICPLDILGTERSESPDAGCFQYKAKKEQ